MITTKTSDLIKYIRDGENGFFVNIENREELVNSLSRITSMSKNEVIKLKQICYVEKSFLPTEFSEKIEVFLNSVIGLEHDKH